ncbi:hypothetical protein ABZP36_023338 [Zizania latifolia]
MQHPATASPPLQSPGFTVTAMGDEQRREAQRERKSWIVTSPDLAAEFGRFDFHTTTGRAWVNGAAPARALIIDRFGMPIQAEGVPRKVADPFDFGGSHIEPDRAVDPGLVYDIEPREYTKFFNCTLGSFDDCESYMGQVYQLNFPSIAVLDLKDSIVVWCTVTNVGATKTSYHVRVEAPAGTTVSVEPSVIAFANNSRTATFKVTFTAKQRVQGGYTFGSLT